MGKEYGSSITVLFSLRYEITRILKDLSLMPLEFCCFTLHIGKKQKVLQQQLSCQLECKPFYVQVGDLQYASPATVSRAGMVYVDPRNLGYEPYWQRWLTQLLQAAGVKEALAHYFDTYVSSALLLILDGISGVQQSVPLRTIIPQTGLNMVRHTLLHVYLFL